ncbi:exodeoxyribonuclease VII small subunit [Sphingobacterium sp. SYP-B4668]|uniref:exodeoxyribonuclease VII small subunit n=1 Tax=Sphingobacterium sp. SYP-B4668 TaxID=2996035 RepID=UPI0022DD4B48|nr:exodeoxyribonuclease VII small subunit [Sphingobacterium sp. SYP-B4668]
MELNYSYTEAYNELQLIVQDIESGTTNIDELSDKIKRAANLIEICRAKLTATEGEVAKLLANLEPPQEQDTEEE